MEPFEVYGNDIKNGNANMRDMTMTMKYSIKGCLLGSDIHITANVDLVDKVMCTIENNIESIPWLDTSKVQFINLSPKVLTSQKQRNKERLKLHHIGFPKDQVDAVFAACHSQVESAKLRGATRGDSSKPIVFTWIPPELKDKLCVLKSMVDDDYSHIYSLSTDMPTNKSAYEQESFYDHVISILVNETPLSINTRLIEFAYNIVGQRLVMFIRIQ